MTPTERAAPAEEHQFRLNCVLFDSWYSSIDNLKLIRSQKWHWCTHLKSNRLVKIAAYLSMETGGTVKFDLKAFHPNLHRALCGTGNERTLKNFNRVAEITQGTDTLTATTLLAPLLS